MRKSTASSWKPSSSGGKRLRFLPWVIHSQPHAPSVGHFLLSGFGSRFFCAQLFVCVLFVSTTRIVSCVCWLLKGIYLGDCDRSHNLAGGADAAHCFPGSIGNRFWRGFDRSSAVGFFCSAGGGCPSGGAGINLHRDHRGHSGLEKDSLDERRLAVAGDGFRGHRWG